MGVSWEKGGIAPIYLCESHVAQVGHASKKSEDIVAVALHSLSSNAREEPPNRSVPSGSAVDAQVRQVGLEKKYLALVPESAPDAGAGASPKVLPDEPIGDMAREDFEAHGTVLQRVAPSTSTEQKQTEGTGGERLCASRYGERCTCEAVVHCPRCGRWYCDAHAEDEKWHHCALPS